MNMARLTFLGTGTSVGVPTIGCTCPVCTSSDRHDRRTRASAMVETDRTRVLIDCGPDFRQQMLQQPFRKIDGVLVTHAHYDHVGGMDDIRPFCTFGEINVYADNRAAGNLRQMMPYCFEEHLYPGVPRIHLNTITPHRMLTINELHIMPITVMHDKLPILGFRIGTLLYITDMKTIGHEEMEYIKGIDTLVVNALRFEPDHHSHLVVSEALDFARQVGASRTYITHICHGMGLHEEVNRQLPHGVQLAYDGQTIEW